MPPDKEKRLKSGAKAQSDTAYAGEEAASVYLSRHGCTILTRNWRANPGEIDIIAHCPARDGTELAFVEVRTRHGQKGLAEETISRRKAASMTTAAYAYMQANNIDPDTTPWRIDLVAVAMRGPSITGINWIRGAIDEEMLGRDA